jgi:hypothetical protein
LHNHPLPSSPLAVRQPWLATALPSQPPLCGLGLLRLHRAALLFRFLSLFAYIPHTKIPFALVCPTITARFVLATQLESLVVA